ncbi:MAG: GTP cyclohydrolase I FolE, partial [Cyanothece sp. SIO1E1]|nr:GTP cyclohydrolase I FolE [Cyanothece sp. SIO1E1]
MTIASSNSSGNANVPLKQRDTSLDRENNTNGTPSRPDRNTLNGRGAARLQPTAANADEQMMAAVRTMLLSVG